MDPVKHAAGGPRQQRADLWRTFARCLRTASTCACACPAQGVNDSKEEIDAVIAFFTPHRYQKNFDGVDLLPYHKLGVGKYGQLDLDYAIKDDPSLTEADLKRIKSG